jgi:hypothetical protein
MDHLDPHFVFLFQLLKDNYDAYSYYIFSTTSAILLIIGWLLTSKDARSYIAGSSSIRPIMYVVIMLFIVAEIYFSWRAIRKSDEIIHLLEVASKTDPLITQAYYLAKRVPRSGSVVFVAAHSALYAILAAIIRSLAVQ